MTEIIQMILAMGAVAFLIWLLMGNTASTSNSPQNGGELIDPNDTRQLATLIGFKRLNRRADQGNGRETGMVIVNSKKDLVR